MNLSELRKEVDEITRIFQSAKYYELDFKYVNSVKYKFPTVYRTYYLFIERIFHSITVALILDLCKLFYKKEKFSFLRLKNKMNEEYEKSELSVLVTKIEFEQIFEPLNTESTQKLLNKLKTTRDEYYAHFDRTRTDFSKIQINSSETAELISIAENLLKIIELKYFKVSVDFNLPEGELGHNIFERLYEWEKYREKYGLLK